MQTKRKYPLLDFAKIIKPRDRFEIRHLNNTYAGYKGVIVCVFKRKSEDPSIIGILDKIGEQHEFLVRDIRIIG